MGNVTLNEEAKDGEDMSKNKTLGWGSRLALIDHYKASDELASATFDIPVDEIETARQLRDGGGAANLPVDIDVEEYGNPFTNITGAVAVKMPGKRVAAESSTRVEAPAKKRGRKGSKINAAFAAIGSSPIPAEGFAATSGVSLNVLRQAKRFDRTGLGRIRVKKIDGTLMVFRETD